MGMTPTICSRFGDAVEEERDPRDELAGLDALSEHLTFNRYAALKRNINQLYSPIVRKLPPDVTSIIFEFCLPDFQLSPYTEWDVSIPLSLGAICSYWRDIAWSTPNLWSSLVVLVPSKHDLHITTGMAEEWLARSGQLPLSIRIIVSGSYKKTISALANIINQYSTRWSHLDLEMPLHCYQHFHATDNHAPILKSIQFHGLNRAMGLNFELTCPRLERAILSFPMGGINIQCDNLTHLTIHSMPIIDSLLILRKTSRLVFCKVSGSCERYRGPSLGALVLTSLKSLQLLIANYAKYFLNNLIAPHLEEFSLPIYYKPSTGVITSFLRRSACSLLSLSMIFSTFPPYFEGFMDILQSMPSLNKLSIISITTTSYFENTFRGDYDPQNILQLVAKIVSSQSTSLQKGFLPNLKIFDYTGELRLSGDFADLNFLLPTGNAMHSPLHLVKFDIHPQVRISKKMISCFLSLVERGITVNVLSKSKDILQSSIDFYGYKKDSFCLDWTDNFDTSLFS